MITMVDIASASRSKFLRDNFGLKVRVVVDFPANHLTTDSEVECSPVPPELFELCYTDLKIDRGNIFRRP